MSIQKLSKKALQVLELLSETEYYVVDEIGDIVEATEADVIEFLEEHGMEALEAEYTLGILKEYGFIDDKFHITNKGVEYITIQEETMAEANKEYSNVNISVEINGSNNNIVGTQNNDKRALLNFEGNTVHTGTTKSKLEIATELIKGSEKVVEFSEKVAETVKTVKEHFTGNKEV